jgi:hypothetical protein
MPEEKGGSIATGYLGLGLQSSTGYDGCFTGRINDHASAWLITIYLNPTKTSLWHEPGVDPKKIFRF